MVNKDLDLLQESVDECPVQRRMVQMLLDGLPHRREELHGCLADRLGPLSNIKSNISKIRKQAHIFGLDIVCVLFQRTVWYRLVRAINDQRDRESDVGRCSSSASVIFDSGR